MTNKNFYITTPIYYPSGKPHMGHAYSSIVADVIARFKRIEGYNVYFLTGTDEHGLKIQREAEKNNKASQVFCDELSNKFKELTKILNLSNNDFIRTTEKRHFKSVEEESYFFKLSAWSKKLLAHYKSYPDFILPNTRKNEVVKFVEKGLSDLSVSRTSFTWGIPVPKNQKHVIYVWLDALTNYLSALDYPDTSSDLYKSFWPADLHIIGKDILRFHAIYWPAFLMAANIPLPKRVFGHGWILSDEKKMSKSIGNILDPIEIIETYGIDQLRYYLIKEVSLGNDGNVSLENLKNCINNDLANNYGNLCQRVFSFIKKNCSNKIPLSKSLSKEDKILTGKLKSDINKLIDLIDKQDLNNYIKKVIEYSFDSNKYFNDLEPWSLKKTNINRMNSVLYSIVEQIKNISILLLPIIPNSANKILDTLNIKTASRSISQIEKENTLNHEAELGNIEILFKKVE